MLVMRVGDRLIAAHSICQNCLLADQAGQPRWQRGQLRCGRALLTTTDALPEQYECQMGFCVTEIELEIEP